MNKTVMVKVIVIMSFFSEIEGDETVQEASVSEIKHKPPQGLVDFFA